VRLGVFGDPIAHSRSPVFQNAALRACGIHASYTRLHADAQNFPAALRALPAAGFLGANVTIPHKAAALAGVDSADDYARASGSVNTVLVDGEKLLGFNTDGPGLVRAVREEFSVDLRDLRVLLLGAMEGCERLVLANRTLEKAARLAHELAPKFHAEKVSGPVERLAAIPLEPAALKHELENCDIVINATSVGMKRTDPPLLPPSMITPNLLVFDTVYSGGASRLLEDAAAAGARGANGLSMLLHQGALSFEIWFNRPAPLESMRRALYAST
jgi:shikimate dehydrogenase